MDVLVEQQPDHAGAAIFSTVVRRSRSASPDAPIVVGWTLFDIQRRLQKPNGWVINRMPTVLRVGGFRVTIFLPPREHPPPHVHVRKGSEEVVMTLRTPHTRQEIRRPIRMRDADVARAYRIVEEHSDYLLNCWREFHG